MAGFDHAQSARLGQRTLVEAPGVYIVADEEHMPEAPYAGQQVWRRDLNQMYVWVIDTWEVVQDPLIPQSAGQIVDISSDMADLAAALATLPDGVDLTAELADLEAALATLQPVVVDIQDQLDAAEAAIAAIPDLGPQLADLQTELDAVQTAIDGLPDVSSLLPDGDPPASSPTPTVIAGIGTLIVKWTAITNHDLVTYEVHISAVSGFTPSPSTLIESTSGHLVGISVLPDGSPVAYGTTYFVKIVALDTDGEAAPSTQASGTPQKVGALDIAPFSITSGELSDFAVTIRKFNTGSHNIY